MDDRQFDTHVNILGWLFIIGHIFFLGIGLFVLVLLTGIGFATGDIEAARILTVVGTAVGILMLFLALPGIIAGYGLLRRRSWGRVLAIIVGLFNLLNFPLGTIFAVYTLYVLLQDGADNYFASFKTA